MNIDVTVTTTPAELIERGLWPSACDLLGLHPEVVRQMDQGQPVILEADVALKLGLLPSALEELVKHRQRTAALLVWAAGRR